jgi:hypothetical protein
LLRLHLLLFLLPIFYLLISRTQLFLDFFLFFSAISGTNNYTLPYIFTTKEAKSLYLKRIVCINKYQDRSNRRKIERLRDGCVETALPLETKGRVSKAGASAASKCGGEPRVQRASLCTYVHSALCVVSDNAPWSWSKSRSVFSYRLYLIIYR